MAVAVLVSLDDPPQVIALPVDGTSIPWEDGTLRVEAGELVAGGSRFRHGERLGLQAKHRFLAGDDLPRMLDEERYFRTVLDPLTGAFNRRFWFAHAPRLRAPTAILFLDIDRFKNVNDTYGMMSGDTVLFELVRRLRRALQPQELAVRFGGEEFVVVVPGADLSEGILRAEQIRVVLEPDYRYEDEDVTATVSIGVAAVAPNVTAEDALRAAESRCDVAKIDGRNRVA